MKYYSIYSEEFKEYGRPLDIDFTDIVNNLKKTPRPTDSTIYCPLDETMQKSKNVDKIKLDVYGGMDIQVGYCNGHNEYLNCLEYHKGVEVNCFESETILLLAKLQEIENNLIDSSKVKAFKVPANIGVEIYQTSLHYAPCKPDGDFRAVIILPLGTNTERPKESKDIMLTAKNKWLLAHKDSNEAKSGALVGLTGENLKVD